MGCSRANLAKGVAAGAAGGLAGTIVMTGFQSAWSALSEKMKGEQEHKSQQHKSEESESGDATAKVAGALAAAGDRKLSGTEKKKFGLLVHYAFGTAMGILYGALTEYGSRRMSRDASLSGGIFGAAVFALADESMVPALGLSPNPKQVPLKTHAYSLTSHLIYGIATGLVTKAARTA